MSKVEVKSVLQAMEKKDIIKMILEMYDARKEAKEYLEFFANPRETLKLEEYKAIIQNKIQEKGFREPKFRFVACRKAISDFKKSEPSSEAIAELMLHYVEHAYKFTAEYGDMWSLYYTPIESYFKRTLKFIVEHKLLDQFQPRIMQCLKYADNCGWGFPDTLWDYYREIVGENNTRSI